MKNPILVCKQRKQW